jgi:Alpha amylase, catalytic domain
MTMPATLLPLDRLGAVETAGTVTFGLWLPWVSAVDRNRVSVKIIHERDQFLQDIPAREFAMSHSMGPPHGDFWEVTVPVAGTPGPTPRSAWGSPGRYVYRYQIDNPDVGALDWIIDPFAREFGPGRMSAFTLGYRRYKWSAAEMGWRTPALGDLAIYEVNIAELGGDLDRAREFLAYLADLGVNAIEVMPLSNVGASVDWGYLPTGYFGVDERFGNRADFQALVDAAHQHGIAVIIDVVYGHTGVGFPYYDAYARLRYHEKPFMGPFAKDYFSKFGKSTDFGRPLTRDYFFSVNHHWLEVYHVDGFRYDCVPNYWDGAPGVGYSGLTSTSGLSQQGLQNLLKLEAPLAVQARTPHAGFFPLNKFSTVPLMMKAARKASSDFDGDDARKDFMILPDTHVLTIRTAPNGTGAWRITGIDTSRGPIDLAPGGIAVVALGTIESARLALASFDGTGIPTLPPDGQEPNGPRPLQPDVPGPTQRHPRTLEHNERGADRRAVSQVPRHPTQR